MVKMLWEIFSQLNSAGGTNIYNYCVSPSALFIADGKNICIPQLRNGTICLRNVVLADTPAHLIITGIYCHSFNLDKEFILYASFVPVSCSNSARCHIIVYSFAYSLLDACSTNEIVYLHPIQNVPITYYPLNLSYTKYFLIDCINREEDSEQQNLHYLLVTDCDGSIHAYELLPETGKLERSPSRDDVAQLWTRKFRIAGSNSIPLRMQIEEFQNGNQGLLGYLDGHLCWCKEIIDSQRLDFQVEIDSAAIERTETEMLLETIEQQCGPAVGKLKSSLTSFELLFDSAVTSIEFYSPFDTVHSFQDGFSSDKSKLFTPAEILRARTCDQEGDGRMSSHMVVGQASGTVLLFDLSDASTVPTPVPVNSDDRGHGAVQALTAGNISFSDCNDIVAGHQDGTVIVFQALASTSNGSISITSFVRTWAVTVAFPVVGLVYGQYLGDEAQPFLTDDGAFVLPCHQLVVITERSTHMFSARSYPDEHQEDSCGPRVTSLGARVNDVNHWLQRASVLSSLLDLRLQSRARGHSRGGAMDIIPELTDDEHDGDSDVNEGSLDIPSEMEGGVSSDPAAWVSLND